MKLHELLDVMDPLIRIEIIVTEVDAYGSLTKAFEGKAGRIPRSVLRRYGNYDVGMIIDRPSIGVGDDDYHVVFDENGFLRFTFKNTIHIYL